MTTVRAQRGLGRAPRVPAPLPMASTRPETRNAPPTSWRDRLRWLHSVRRMEAATLAVLAMLAAGLWAFVEIAGEVVEGDSLAFDRTVLLALRSGDDMADPLGPPWVEELVRDVTALGSFVYLALLTALVCGYLLLHGQRRTSLVVLLAVVGGSVYGTVLKQLFARPRPDVVEHVARVHSLSFPSGHSLMAAVVYMTLGALLARIQDRRSLKLYCIFAAVLLTTLVGLSRLYLGVHYPTDVLAGWSAGAVWALLCWLVLRRLQVTHQVEAPPEESAEPVETAA